MTLYAIKYRSFIDRRAISVVAVVPRRRSVTTIYPNRLVVVCGRQLNGQDERRVNQPRYIGFNAAKYMENVSLENLPRLDFLAYPMGETEGQSPIE